MAKDDDLSEEQEQTAEDLLPDEAAATAPTEEVPSQEQPDAAAQPAPAAAPLPTLTAEMDAKPRSDVWTLLMIVIFVTMIAGIYLHLNELNEIYKVDVLFMKSSKETAKPAEGASDTTTPATKPPDSGAPAGAPTTGGAPAGAPTGTPPAGTPPTPATK